MRVVDANVLLYAMNEADPRHDGARTWLRRALTGGETVGFAWMALIAFVRISTKTGVFPSPLPVTAATDLVRSWLDQPPSVIVEPTREHLDVVASLLESVGTAGNLVVDAHLAALAIEHDATVVTYDRDFGRFEGVRWEPPT